MSTLCLTAEDWFRVKGPRSQHLAVATVPAPFPMSRKSPEIVGLEVIIDGVRRRVVGVERHMPAFDIREGERIGLVFDDAGPIIPAAVENHSADRPENADPSPSG